jgi:hypothetical protein
MTVLLAAGDPTGEAAKSGPWGLAMILLLVVVCFFLFRSMSRHMRKVREEFPVEGTVDPSAPGASAREDAPAQSGADLRKRGDGAGTASGSA